MIGLTYKLIGLNLEVHSFAVLYKQQTEIQEMYEQLAGHTCKFYIYALPSRES